MNKFIAILGIGVGTLAVGVPLLISKSLKNDDISLMNVYKELEDKDLTEEVKKKLISDAPKYIPKIKDIKTGTTKIQGASDKTKLLEILRGELCPGLGKKSSSLKDCPPITT